MKQRKWLWLVVPLLAILAAGVVGYSYLTSVHADTTNLAKGPKGADPLPIRQVVLFNSGVGYFQREGEVEGNARIDLSFPVGDINDLLKSLVLQDAKGRIGTVNYDSSDPIEKILRSFALDLTGNPTFGQILNQARGEKIEISRSEKKDGQTTKLVGTVIGMEIQHRPVGKDQLLDVEILNLNTPTGLQAIPMEQVVSVRFQNAVLENEFQRALQVLARSHDTQKKTVSVGFNGDGKRNVKVGYVVERPIWKTSYRLRIDDKGKVFLQGWALVENTSDDDWNDVRMVLVSGKPISFRMNLYDPIYVPRPFVEPELFASLRPPVYGGALDEGKKDGQKMAQAKDDIITSEEQLLRQFAEFQDALLKLRQRMSHGTPEERKRAEALTKVIDQCQNLAIRGANAQMIEMMRAVNINSTSDIKSVQDQSETITNKLLRIVDSLHEAPDGGNPVGNSTGQVDPGNFRKLAADWGRLPPREQERKLAELQRNVSPRHREAIEQYFRSLSEGKEKSSKKQMDAIKKLEEAGYDSKIADVKKRGGEIAGFNFKEGIKSVATADEVGDYYQYTIDQKISLPRQKSAMLPIFDQTIEGQKVSIYNEAIHARYPLLGLKLKNTSGQPLTQGPITVYDGGVFGGDTRILDVQPNEERLLSYALDQGTEVKTDVKQSISPDLNFRIGAGELSATYTLRQTKTYTIKNRSTHDRQLLLEHPLRSDWKLTDAKKAAEQTRDLYRFQVSVPAGKTVVYEVVEESPRVDNAGGSSYAIAEGINIKVDLVATGQEPIGIKIVKGFVIETFKHHEARMYSVQNLSDIDRTFTVDHVVRPGWVRLDEKAKAHAGPEVFRFKMAAAKGKTAQYTVPEERIHVETGTLIKNLPEVKVHNWIVGRDSPSAAVKAALTKALAMQTKINETQKQIGEVEKQLNIVTIDHTRVRENLKIVPMTSEHYKTFLEKFVGQDKQIETFQREVRELNGTLQTQIRNYDAFLAKLDAE